MFAACPLAIRLSGINTFTRNRAFTGGAILNDEGSSFSPPQDGGELIFEDNRADVGAGKSRELFKLSKEACYGRQQAQNCSVYILRYFSATEADGKTMSIPSDGRMYSLLKWIYMQLT